MRRRKRVRCSSFDKFKNNFTILIPLSVRLRSQVVDLSEAALPYSWPAAVFRQLLVLQQLRMYANDEYLLVIRPIEDPNLATSGQPLCEAPEIVVIKLRTRGNLEAVHRHTLRIDAAHHMPNRSVLTGSVERLKHNEHAVSVIRVQPGLILSQQVNAARQHS